MFYMNFLNVACDLQSTDQSRNNNNGPNKKNDVITDLGGEGDFPMFLFVRPTSPSPPNAPPNAIPSSALGHSPATAS
jgi:hypothetical protein